MAQVTVTIAGRVYRMACAEGEQPHLESLARMVDAKIDSLRGSFGEIGDQRITVMAALTFADELLEANRRIAELEVDIFNARNNGDNVKADADASHQALTHALGQVASRIEALAHGMNGGRS